MKNETKSDLRRAVAATLPVLTGYVVLGMGFGVILQSRGYGVLWVLAMSVFIYAGSMQYVAIDLLTGGASLFAMALTTLAVNARHLFYGLALLEKYRIPGLKRLYLIFGMCDESFSINCSAEPPEGVDRSLFMFFVTLLNQCYWVAGCTLGGIFGSLLTFNTEGLDFAMTAMFVVIFLENWLKEKNHTSSLVGLGVTLLSLVIFGADKFVIPAMLAILGVLTLLRRPIEKAGEAA